MKTKIYFTIAAFIAVFVTACEEDREYALGLPEYDHHYYIAFTASNNTMVTVPRNQAALLKLPVQFHSSFTRNYDAIAHYKVVSPATNIAVLGVDFNVVDKNGNVIQPVNGKYAITFQQAKRRTDTIYVKLLNNTATGVRNTEIQLMENVTSEYRVDTMSTAFRRPIRIQ